MVPQSGAKDQFHSSVYNITLNTICVTQTASKILKIVEDRVKRQNE
jgi:hypothetical protein